MYDVRTIAEWFLAYNEKVRNFDDEDTDMISNLKLQKLLYYAQGAFLAIKDVRLFDEPILAWMHGPVVESMYQKYKSNGARGIAPDENFENNVVNDINKEDKSLLVDVYETFGKYSAWGLRQMTHEESPWQETEQGEEIPCHKIGSYFKEHYI